MLRLNLIIEISHLVGRPCSAENERRKGGSLLPVKTVTVLNLALSDASKHKHADSVREILALQKVFHKKNLRLVLPNNSQGTLNQSATAR